MINTWCGLAQSKKYVGHLFLLVGIALLTSLIFSSIKIPSAQAHTPPKHVIPNFPIDKFGALGNGVADDTKAIEGAIAAAVKARGGNLTAGPGTYCFSAALTLPTGVTLTGSSMSAVTFKPTKSGAAFILQGSSGISSCTLDEQPGGGGYYLGAQDPNPTQRSLYGTAGASVKLTSVNLASVDFIDCNAISVLDCTATSSISIFGSHNIAIEKVNFNKGYLNVEPDAKQRQSVGLSLVSCTWAQGAGNNGCCYLMLGGGVAKGAYQVIEDCNFANNQATIYINNDKSAAHTYLSFANNVCSGTSEESSLTLQNGNPNVVVYITGNKFNTVPFPSLPYGPTAVMVFNPPVLSSTGLVVMSNNSFWAPVACSGGRISITGNKFSNLGQIDASISSNGWIGPLTISNNSFSLSGATLANSSYSTIFVELSATDSKSLQGPVTIENNKCVSTTAIKAYILVLDAANDKTNVSGNTVSPAGAMIAVLHDQNAFDALLQQLIP